MKISAFTIAAVAISTLLPVTQAVAEKQTVAFNSENWSFISAAKVEKIGDRDALRIGASTPENPFTFGMAVMKGAPFENGTIEYDVKFDETVTFNGIQFRIESPGNMEQFYMRAHHSNQPDANQYMPIYNDMHTWQLHYGKQYSAPTTYKFNEWMHVKLVMVDGLMDVFINDDSKPQFTTVLKRDQVSGGVAFWGLDIGGSSWVSNFSIDRDSGEKISGTPVPVVLAKPGTVKNWHVSNAVNQESFKGVTTLKEAALGELKYTTLKSEKTGLANLAKIQGHAKDANTTLAKINITSDKDQTKAFTYGYSDDAIVFLNGQAISAGSQRFQSRDYRYLGTISYSDVVYLPLKKGDNELVIAVSATPPAVNGGWAVQGRFDDESGITVK